LGRANLGLLAPLAAERLLGRQHLRLLPRHGRCDLGRAVLYRHAFLPSSAQLAPLCLMTEPTTSTPSDYVATVSFDELPLSRALALQVAQELQALGKHKDVSVVAIYGGAPMDAQTKALREGAEIIVGTPGRVLDHIRRGTLKLQEAKIAVLDEADEMLSSGFY